MWPLLGALAGLVAGSFLATLVLRWPAGRALSGRSVCDCCATPVAARDLVPLLSFILLRGRCRACGAAIDRRHPAIEAAAMAIGTLALWTVPGPAGFASALFGWLLLALVALDTEHHWLPDALTLPLLGAGLLLGPGTFPERLMAAALAGGALLLLRGLHRRLAGREGLGLGDVKLAAALGAWLGAASLPLLLLGASLLGLAMVLVRRARGEAVTGTSIIPFGACLALAALPLHLAQMAGSLR